MASTLRAVVAGPGRRHAIARLAFLILVLALPGLPGCNALTPHSAPTVAIVQPGESVYDVARRSNVPLRDLIELNGLNPPYTLQAGQVLRLPQPREYVVQSGDSLYEISRRFGVDSSELAQLNGLRPPYTIYVGQRLRLPSGQGETLAEVPFRPPAPPRRPGSGTAAAVPAGAGQPGASAPLPLGPRAGAGGSAVTAVPLEPLPSGVPSAAAPAADPSAAAPAPASPAPAAETPVAAAPPSSAGGAAEPSRGAPSSGARPAGQPASLAPPRAGGRFQWPVTGQLVSGYGPKPDGLHNDGINIAAPAGTPVLAAENGVVAYTGNELRGYGNLLLIRHSDGWVTAYAHTDRILVARGDRVRAGQQIATVGSTGSVSSPQLHFEIRQGTRAIDPLEQMPPAPRRAGG